MLSKQQYTVPKTNFPTGTIKLNLDLDLDLENIHLTDLFDFLGDLVDAVGILLGLLHTQAGVLGLVSDECDVSL